MLRGKAACVSAGSGLHLGTVSSKIWPFPGLGSAELLGHHWGRGEKWGWKLKWGRGYGSSFFADWPPGQPACPFVPLGEPSALIATRNPSCSSGVGWGEEGMFFWGRVCVGIWFSSLCHQDSSLSEVLNPPQLVCKSIEHGRSPPPTASSELRNPESGRKNRCELAQPG